MLAEAIPSCHRDPASPLDEAIGLNTRGKRGEWIADFLHPSQHDMNWGTWLVIQTLPLVFFNSKNKMDITGEARRRVAAAQKVANESGAADSQLI